MVISLVAVKVKCVWPVEDQLLKEMWKFVLMTFGTQYVTTTLALLKHKWYVLNLDSQKEVRCYNIKETCKPLFHYFVVLIDVEVLYVGESVGLISTTEFDCTGDEVALQNCRNYTQSYNCYVNRYRHVGVKCEQGI